MAGNGSSVTPETNKHKRFYGHLHYRFTGNLHATITGDISFRPKVNSPAEGQVSNNDITGAFFIGYMEENKFSIGIETVTNIRQNDKDFDYSDRHALGISLFTTYDFIPTFGALFRYDYFDPNLDIENNKINYFVIGGNYRPIPSVHIMPNILLETFEALPQGDKIKSSVTARISISYFFP
jgi:hypothetical protein